MLINLQDINYLNRRVKLLRETAAELKRQFKNTKNSALEDLYLEIQCYSDEIEWKIKQIKKKK